MRKCEKLRIQNEMPIRGRLGKRRRFRGKQAGRRINYPVDIYIMDAVFGVVQMISDVMTWKKAGARCV